MGQSVEKGTGQALGAEGFGPFIEWQVAGDHCGAGRAKACVSRRAGLSPGPGTTAVRAGQ